MHLSWTEIHGSILKEEIKAVYGYGTVYAVPTVSRLNPLAYNDERQQQGEREGRGNNVKFADVFQKSLNAYGNETRNSMGNYTRNGVYQEYVYLRREYRC